MTFSEKIGNTIQTINEKTHKSYTNLTDGIQELLDGYKTSGEQPIELLRGTLSSDGHIVLNNLNIRNKGFMLFIKPASTADKTGIAFSINNNEWISSSSGSMSMKDRIQSFIFSRVHAGQNNHLFACIEGSATSTFCTGVINTSTDIVTTSIEISADQNRNNYKVGTTYILYEGIGDVNVPL